MGCSSSRVLTGGSVSHGRCRLPRYIGVGHLMLILLGGALVLILWELRFTAGVLEGTSTHPVPSARYSSGGPSTGEETVSAVPRSSKKVEGRHSQHSHAPRQNSKLRRNQIFSLHGSTPLISCFETGRHWRSVKPIYQYYGGTEEGREGDFQVEAADKPGYITRVWCPGNCLEDYAEGCDCSDYRNCVNGGCNGKPRWVFAVETGRQEGHRSRSSDGGAVGGGGHPGSRNDSGGGGSGGGVTAVAFTLDTPICRAAHFAGLMGNSTVDGVTLVAIRSMPAGEEGDDENAQQDVEHVPVAATLARHGMRATVVPRVSLSSARDRVFELHRVGFDTTRFTPQYWASMRPPQTKGEDEDTEVGTKKLTGASVERGGGSCESDSSRSSRSSNKTIDGPAAASSPVLVYFDTRYDISWRYRTNEGCSNWCRVTTKPSEATLLVSGGSIPWPKRKPGATTQRRRPQLTVGFSREALDRSLHGGVDAYDLLMTTSLFSNVPITSVPNSMPGDLLLPRSPPGQFRPAWGYLRSLLVPSAAEMARRYFSVWVSSVCRSTYGRGRFIEEVRAFIPVHCRGTCLNNYPAAPMTRQNRSSNYQEANFETYVFLYHITLYGYMIVHSLTHSLAPVFTPSPYRYSKYLFVFGTENSMAEGYHTEKFYDPFVANSLLVYLGPRHADRYGPSDVAAGEHPSFVDATLFDSPRALAEHLIFLSQHPKEYAKYFSWRQRAKPPKLFEHAQATSIFAPNQLCRLCSCRCDPQCHGKRHIAASNAFARPPSVAGAGTVRVAGGVSGETKKKAKKKTKVKTNMKTNTRERGIQKEQPCAPIFVDVRTLVVSNPDIEQYQEGGSALTLVVHHSSQLWRTLNPGPGQNQNQHARSRAGTDEKRTPPLPWRDASITENGVRRIQVLPCAYNNSHRRSNAAKDQHHYLSPLVNALLKTTHLDFISGHVEGIPRPICHLAVRGQTIVQGYEHGGAVGKTAVGCVRCDSLPDVFLARTAALRQLWNEHETSSSWRWAGDGTHMHSGIDRMALGEASQLDLFLRAAANATAFCPTIALPSVAAGLSAPFCNGLGTRFDASMYNLATRHGVRRIIRPDKTTAWLTCVFGRPYDHLPFSCHRFINKALFDTTDALDALRGGGAGAGMGRGRGGKAGLDIKVERAVPNAAFPPFKYHISFGTALGILRNHSSIPWSWDADICVGKLLSRPGMAALNRHFRAVLDGRYVAKRISDMWRVFYNCPVVVQQRHQEQQANNDEDPWGADVMNAMDALGPPRVVPFAGDGDGFPWPWRVFGYIDLYNSDTATAKKMCSDPRVQLGVLTMSLRDTEVAAAAAAATAGVGPGGRAHGILDFKFVPVSSIDTIREEYGDNWRVPGGSVGANQEGGNKEFSYWRGWTDMRGKQCKPTAAVTKYVASLQGEQKGEEERRIGTGHYYRAHPNPERRRCDGDSSSDGFGLGLCEVNNADVRSCRVQTLIPRKRYGGGGSGRGGVGGQLSSGEYGKHANLAAPSGMSGKMSALTKIWNNHDYDSVVGDLGLLKSLYNPPSRSTCTLHDHGASTAKCGERRQRGQAAGAGAVGDSLDLGCNSDGSSFAALNASRTGVDAYCAVNSTFYWIDEDHNIHDASRFQGLAKRQDGYDLEKDSPAYERAVGYRPWQKSRGVRVLQGSAVQGGQTKAFLHVPFTTPFLEVWCIDHETEMQQAARGKGGEPVLPVCRVEDNKYGAPCSAPDYVTSRRGLAAGTRHVQMFYQVIPLPSIAATARKGLEGWASRQARVQVGRLSSLQKKEEIVHNNTSVPAASPLSLQPGMPPRQRRPLHIAVILVDSLSRAEFARLLPRTTALLSRNNQGQRVPSMGAEQRSQSSKSSAPFSSSSESSASAPPSPFRSFFFNRFSSVYHAGTAPQVGAMFGGWTYNARMEEYRLEKAANPYRGVAGEEKTWLWEHLHRYAGYVSTVATCWGQYIMRWETHSDSHHQPSKVPIKNKNWSGDRLCKAGRLLSRWDVEWVKAFYESLRARTNSTSNSAGDEGDSLYNNLPGFSYLHLDEAHDGIEGACQLDAPLADLVSFLLDGTRDIMLVLGSDHGGTPAHLPFMSVTVPKTFLDRRVGVERALFDNQDRLASPFDIFKTILDAVEGDLPQTQPQPQEGGEVHPNGHPNPTMRTSGAHDATVAYVKGKPGRSLFSPLPLDRTCSDAGTADTCVCVPWGHTSRDSTALNGVDSPEPVRALIDEALSEAEKATTPVVALRGPKKRRPRLVVPNIYRVVSQTVVGHRNTIRNQFANSTSCKTLILERVYAGKVRLLRNLRRKPSSPPTGGWREHEQQSAPAVELLVHVSFGVVGSHTARFEASVRLEIPSRRRLGNGGVVDNMPLKTTDWQASINMARQTSLYKDNWQCADSRININWCLCGNAGDDPTSAAERQPGKGEAGEETLQGTGRGGDAIHGSNGGIQGNHGSDVEDGKGSDTATTVASSVAPGSSAVNGDVRITGSRTGKNSDGLLEFHWHGAWGTVCNDVLGEVRWRDGYTSTAEEPGSKY